MTSKQVVFKKFSKDKSVAVYMAKRDFVDHGDFVDPVDGVVLIDPALLKGSKVYVTLSCMFRYGYASVAEVPFRRDLFVATRQVYPEPQEKKDRPTHTDAQENLLRKLGNNAYPFFFEFPDNLPCSVCLHPGPSDAGKKCEVEFEVKVFSAESKLNAIDKPSSVCLSVRKIQFAPVNSRAAVPSAEMMFEFLMSDKPLHLKVSLEKETYYHGEPVKARVEITNLSKRNVKDISVSVEQVTNIVLYYNDKYIKPVAKEETGDCVPSGASMKKDYTLRPLLALNKDRRGLALDGKLKHEDTNLASSSVVKEEVLKEVLGILVSYKVVVRMLASGMLGSSEVSLEVPFKLMHPKPDPARGSESGDMVFEEFNRSYVKGVIADDDESPTEA